MKRVTPSPKILLKFILCCIVIIYLLIYLLPLFISFMEFCKEYSFEKYYTHWGPQLPLKVLVLNNKPISKASNTILNVDKRSLDNIDILLVVKSDVKRFDRRQAIRQTWGKNQGNGSYFKTIFFVAKEKNETDYQITKEYSTYKDIVQVDVIEDYFNLTEKTISIVSWALEYCPRVSYFMVIDDDYYLSPKNLISFLQKNTQSVKEINYLFAGHTFRDASPIRWTFNKYFVSVKDYPYNRYPPYIAGGAYIISQKSLKLLQLGCLYTNYFQFEDVFLGMAAKKANLNLTHSDEFRITKPFLADDYKHVIAAHEHGEPEELIRVWNEQSAMGNV